MIESLTETPFAEGVQRASLAGVPVLWADAPDPFVGALMFRVGRVDETLCNAGLTHLVEHLALSAIERGQFQYNGHVEPAVTVFFASGTRDEVLQYLSGISSALRALPLDRLEGEKRILRSEASMTAGNVDTWLLALRFGAAGYGLVHHAELGLDWVTRDEVADWAQKRFTADNAVIWLTGKPPESLANFDLVPGTRVPPPAPEPIPSLKLPAHLGNGAGRVALSVTGERSAMIHAGFLIALERAHGRLRRDEAVSYAPGGSYLPLDGRIVHVMISADCKDQDAGLVQDELLRILDDLGEHGPTEKELEWDRSMLERALSEKTWAHSALDVGSRDTLMGIESPDRNQLLREREELTPAGVATAIAEALESLLVLSPPAAPKTGIRPRVEYSADNTELVEGTRYEPSSAGREVGQTSDLIVGERGLSHVAAGGADVMSWLFDESVAGIRLVSGGLTVVGREGSWVTIYPRLYNAGDAALSRIESGLGAARIVPLNARESELQPLIVRELGDTIAFLGPEIDGLPGLLGDTEEIRSIASAWKGQYRGVLAVTSARLLFLFQRNGEKELFEMPLSEIGIATKGLRTKRLVASHDGATTEFHAIEPRGRIQEINAALAEPART